VPPLCGERARCAGDDRAREIARVETLALADVAEMPHSCDDKDDHNDHNDNGHAHFDECFEAGYWLYIL